MYNSKSYLAEILDKGPRDNSKNYLLELITKALAPSTPDYLLEDTKADIETILLLKDKEKLKPFLERHTQRLHETKEYLRKEHIGRPYPEIVDAFLDKFYAWIDDIDHWVIDAIENWKLSNKKYRELQNTRDSLYNRWCVILRAETDFFEEKRKQAEKRIRESEKKLSETELASKQKKGEDDGAYIPITKAIKFSNGILTLKKLNKAIEQGQPIKVRSKKPRINRKSVHIQDVLSLINKLSENDKPGEEAARMFGEYQKQYEKKRNEQINLD